MTRTIDRVFVPGTPVPQGSAKGFVVNGRAVITAANGKTKPWRNDVAATVRTAVGDEIVFPTEAIWLDLEFVMPRRSAEPKRATPPHTRKPDLDKLIRAIGDALTGIVYTDDAQTVGGSQLKRTAAIGEQPGVWISAKEWVPA